MGRAEFPPFTGFALIAGWVEFLSLGGPNFLYPLGEHHDRERCWLSALLMVAQVPPGVGLEDGRLQASLGTGLWALLRASAVG